MWGTTKFRAGWLDSLYYSLPSAHAQSGVKQLVLSACQSVIKILAWTLLYITQTMTVVITVCMVYLKVAEVVLFREFPAICGRSLVPRLHTSTQISLGTRLSWPRIHRARKRVQSMRAGHAHSTGIVSKWWNRVWERGVSVLRTPLVPTVSQVTRSCNVHKYTWPLKMSYTSVR